MFVFLLHVLVISKAFYQVSCTGILKIDFKEFDSGTERTYNRKNCCANSRCNKCIFQFHICITHQKTAKVSCINTADIETYSSNKVSFDHVPLNPLHITAEEVLGEYLLAVTINSKGSLFDKMQTSFSVSMAIKAGSEKKLQNLEINGASIPSRYREKRVFKYAVSAQCSPGFSPPDCSKLACVGRDDITGHYKCSDDREKICLDGWKNVTSNCTERNVPALHTSILASTSTLSVQSSSVTSSATISSRHSSKATSQYQMMSKQSTSVISLLQTTLKVSSSVTTDDFSSSTILSSLISQHHMTSSLSLLPTPSFSRLIDIKTMSLFSNKTERLLKTILSQLPSIYTTVSSTFSPHHEPVTSKMTAAFSSAPERSVYTWSSISDTLTDDVTPYTEIRASTLSMSTKNSQSSPTVSGSGGTQASLSFSNKISSNSVFSYSSMTTKTSIDEFSTSTSRLDTLLVTLTTVSALASTDVQRTHTSTDVQRLLPSMTSIHTDIPEPSSSYYFVTTNKEENKITTIYTSYFSPSQFLSETSTTPLMPTTSLMTKLSTTPSTPQQSTTSSTPKLLITSATTQLETSSLLPKLSTTSSTTKVPTSTSTPKLSTSSSMPKTLATPLTPQMSTTSSTHLLPPISTSQSHFEKNKINYILLAVASVAVILVIVLAACLACQRKKIRKKLKSHQYQLQELRGVVLSNNGHLNIPLNTLNYDEDAMVRHDRNKTLMETPGSEFIGFHNEMYLNRNGLRIYDEPKDFASHPTDADTADFPEPPTDMLGDSTEYNENSDSYPTAAMSPPITTSNTPPTMSLQDELKNTLNSKLHSPPTNLGDKSSEPIDRLDNKPANHIYDRVGNNNCPKDTRLANRYMINNLYNVEENVFTGFRNKGFEAPE